ncbi:NUDIX hydrolase [Microbacterium hominis]|uniref:NUDIX domain-containing protein n=1 Tax=Microbacterium hominis TaxID=162426 RepID=A0A7D4Q1N7_9MICO|nr:NUDIX domain-containing protein [Microbacterium hominis]QKJ19958.1 NUDIX domain-containing protein [Microbacterium hominis]
MSEPTPRPPADRAAPPADRAARALADTLDRARPRLPGDADDAAVPTAATVVLVRDGEAGAEVLLIERPDRGSFAGAWVFPGGKIDDADRTAAGTGPAGDDDAEHAAAVEAAIRETREETGLVVARDALIPLSVWDPPPGIALRIRTWFFVAAAPDGTIVLSPDEAVAAEWLRPEEALSRHGRGEVTLYPPTWVTLHALQRQPTAAALLALVRAPGVERFESVARRGPTGPMLLWQEDAAYDDETAGEASTRRHRLQIGALPWIYTREG